MRYLPVIGLALCSVSFGGGAHQHAPTIEGYWQDVAGRTLFQRGVAPNATYGDWHARELDATYPQAKRVRQVQGGYELVDLNYAESEYTISVLTAAPGRIEYLRQASWSPCRMHHACRLEGEHMLCALQNVCRERANDVVDWRGEERYVRRAHCERDGRAQLQGIPVKCR